MSAAGKELPPEISFEAWLDYVFDHPVKEVGPEWYWEDDAPTWQPCAAPQRTVEFITRLFADPFPLTTRFTSAQLNQGLWFIASPECSNHMYALLDEAVPWTLRERCFDSMYSLYEKLFLPKCSIYYSHLGRGPEAPLPLNLVCFMWFDLAPTGAPASSADGDKVVAVTLSVLERILALDSIPCQEAALHGLGHMTCSVPDRAMTIDIIDRYLTRPGVPAELRAYANAARRGRIQ
ncbi:MAG: hypothetical protein L0Z55_05905 [Planctomycetes bacterium]|nr:hypothetical protein [Planctomycetota bacterium]